MGKAPGYLPCWVFLVMHHGGADDPPGPYQPVGDIEITQNTMGQRHRQRGVASSCRYKPVCALAALGKGPTYRQRRWGVLPPVKLNGAFFQV